MVKKKLSVKKSKYNHDYFQTFALNLNRIKKAESSKSINIKLL
jgi:hypothetical protein